MFSAVLNAKERVIVVVSIRKRTGSAEIVNTINSLQKEMQVRHSSISSPIPLHMALIMPMLKTEVGLIVIAKMEKEYHQGYY